MDALDRMAKYREDPWAFAVDCVFTQDPQDLGHPKKPFPGDFEYLKFFFKLWIKNKRILVPKSRRMFMSWGCITLYLWDALFHKGRHFAFVSKKEEDADALIERCKYILENIPEDKIPKEFLPKFIKTYCFLHFPETGSKIQAFPSGSDQLRMYGFSGILADEMAFWDDAKNMYSAAFPTIENGGRFTGISSAYPGFFQKLVFDMLDDGDVPGQAEHKFPIDGIELWKNDKNQFIVYQIHYTADPRKREGYIDGIKSGMPIQQFLQEFEISWETFEGKPVYPDWVKTVHGFKQGIEPELGLPLLLGMDFGLTPAMIVCQLQGDCLVVLKEYTEENMGAQRFADKVKKRLAIDFPAWRDFKRDYVLWVDPAGFVRKDTDENTCANVLMESGFNPMPGPVTWEQRRAAVEHFLIRYYKGQPAFKVSMGNAPLLVKGFNGGYRYPDKAFEIEPSKIRPVKDIHSHVQDALQYVCFGIKNQRRSGGLAVPSPSYSFSSKKKDLRVS